MILADHVAGRRCRRRRALRRAGAVILGKANLSELAGAMARTPGVSAVGGQTRNPYGERFTPGGSSSGSAVSVAAGLCLGSLGTETSGSLIAPASLQRRRGHEAQPRAGQPGRRRPARPLPGLGGPAGPDCVADAAALLRAIANGGLELELSADALQGVPVGVLREDILAQKTPVRGHVRQRRPSCRGSTDGLLAAGASVHGCEPGADGALSAFESGFTKVVLGRPVPRHDGLPRGGRRAQ